MSEQEDKINRLQATLEHLAKKQDEVYREINALRAELNSMKPSAPAVKPVEVRETPIPVTQPVKTTPEPILPKPPVSIPPVPAYTAPKQYTKSSLEKFVGENLISKIGIAITIIGAAIGAKYTIDHNLISPTMRIMLGYLLGLGLVGFGMKLKPKYENFSAVLVSGAMTILFFITYFAYSLYSLLPQAMTFMLMVVFTAFTVFAAIKYNRQLIAHIGLVGAYAVPFLLSDGSGRVHILFSYMAIINVGILIIAIKKYWKLLYYSSFTLTWLIYAIWYFTEYSMYSHYTQALVFLTLFFVIFYGIFLAYKLINKEVFRKTDVVLLLANSFIYYGIGYAILDQNSIGTKLLGLFTLCNAVLHFTASVIIYRRKSADRNIFFLLAGLVLVFITITIPVQLNGNWVTLLWAAEAALLFWLGRSKKVTFYETLAYPLMFLAIISQLQDWALAVDNYYPEAKNAVLPLFNITFLSSVLFTAAFAFIYYCHTNKKYLGEEAAKKKTVQAADIGIPAALLLLVYGTFLVEILVYWNQAIVNASATTQQGITYYIYSDHEKYQTLWILNYTMLYLSVLGVVNMRKIKSEILGIVNVILGVLVIAMFLMSGLYEISELRENYLDKTLAGSSYKNVYNIAIRYISLAFLAALVVVLYNYCKTTLLQKMLPKPAVAFSILLHVVLLWVLTSELISWMDMIGSSQMYKLGLSIFWGAYALMLIALGIWKKKQYLRIGAIALFGVTLIKLFVYDIAHLNTIAKTIVFISLGILLLIISFLYNKYKHLIAEENES